MKTLKILFILLVVISRDGISQNAYYEAIYFSTIDLESIKNNIHDATNVIKAEGISDNVFFKGLKDNTDGFKSTLLTSQDRLVLHDLYLFKTDPFKNKKPNLEKLKTAFNKFNYTPDLKFSESVTPFSLANLANPLGLLTLLPTAQADTILKGIAVYATEQAKRTHNETVMNLINSRLGKYKDFQELFPSTYKKLTTQDWTKIKDLGNEFKAVFKKDYQNSPTNFFKFIENSSTLEDKDIGLLKAELRKKIFSDDKYMWARILGDVGLQLNEGVHVVKILQYIDENYQNKTIHAYGKQNDFADIHQYFHALNLIQESVRDTSKKLEGKFSNVWISYDKLKKIDDNPEIQLYYLALLRNQDITTFDELIKNFVNKDVTITANNANQISNFYAQFRKTYLSPILITLLKSEDYLKMKEGKLYESDNFLNYLKFINTLILEFNFKSDKLKKENLAELFDNISGIINAIKTENYGNFISDFAGVLKFSFDKDLKNSYTEPKNKEEKEIRKGYSFINTIDFFGSFSSSIINAKTSEDINNVLKSYSKQNTSYTVSRNKKFTIGLIATPGLFYGWERDRYKHETQEKECERVRMSVSGLSLPVGLKFSVRPYQSNSWAGRNLGAISLMFNPIDLGSLVNYRWTSQLTSPLSPDSTSKKNTSDFIKRNTGFGFTLGLSLKTLPLNFEFGIQKSYSRQGFLVDKNEVEFTRRNFFRISYDIPLFTIYKTNR